MYSPPLSLRKHLIFFPNSFSTASLNSTNFDNASLFSFKNFTQVYLEKSSTNTIT
ncbi:hypothetical protein Sjap_004145 [Stephania japonica]|uniref:Uncharacterized protein n=1 Tax=Stephania japonica TaxID=461633 RepID=A0AAP0K3Y3_9MAGN